MINNQKNKLFFLILLLTSPFWANGINDAQKSLVSNTLTDYYNRPVRINPHINRIVSLAPGITETIFALGHGNKLAGRTDYDDFPPEVHDVPSVGNMTHPDMEVILSLSPDLVIASNHCPRSVVHVLEQANISTAVLMAGKSIESVYDGVIRPVAAFLGDSDSGVILINEMETVRKKAKAIAARFPYRPKVYYAVGFGEGGDWTAGGDTIIGTMIQESGGYNIAQSVSGWSFSLEALVNADPDIIIIPDNQVQKFSNAPVYSGLRAVQEGRLIGINEDIVARQGPRIADGLATLVDAIGTMF